MTEQSETEQVHTKTTNSNLNGPNMRAGTSSGTTRLTETNKSNNINAQSCQC